MTHPHRIYNPHISVDCVLFGYKDSCLYVLLLERTLDEVDNTARNDFKLPGDLIFEDENLDDAPIRVLYELTGLVDPKMMQFKAFGALSRTKNPLDKFWLENVSQQSITRIVSVAYVSLVKIVSKLNTLDASYQAKWFPLAEIQTKQLAFDHNEIIMGALEHIRKICHYRPTIIYDLLPKKFTASELRKIYEVLFNQQLDVRNFHKKLISTPYVVPLEERQEGVPHRAARYYRFDKKIYNKFFNGRRKKDNDIFI